MFHLNVGSHVPRPTISPTKYDRLLFASEAIFDHSISREDATYGCSMNKLVLKQSSGAMQWQQEQGGNIGGHPEP